MGAIKVYLLYLIMTEIIVEGVAESVSPPNTVTLSLSSSKRLECSPKSVVVQLNSIVVSSGMVYWRTSLSSQLFEASAVDGVQLTASSFAHCSKAAYGAGYPAFEFNGKCTAYNLATTSFSKCNSGDHVLYMTEDSFSEDGNTTTVPFDEAPYGTGDLPNSRQYFLTDLSYTEDNIPWTSNFAYADSYNSWASYLTSENGTKFAIHYHLLDIPSCLTNSAQGMPILVSPVVYNRTLSVLYILNECGNTVDFSEFVRDPSQDELVFYSHAGLGCVDFPGEEDIDCRVAVKHDTALLVQGFQMNFVEDDVTCGGLTVEATYIVSGYEYSGIDLCKMTRRYTFTTRNENIELILHVKGRSPERKIGFSGYLKEDTSS